MTEYPLKLSEIVAWYESKQLSLTASTVSLVEIHQRTEYLPAAWADFDGPGALGRIDGWVSGEFDFHALRASDGKDILWRHVKVAGVGDELEQTYADFLRALQNPDTAKG